MMNIADIAGTIFGARNDATFFDGWRTYGDAWARRYLRTAVQRGADRVGAPSIIRAADRELRGF